MRVFFVFFVLMAFFSPIAFGAEQLQVEKIAEPAAVASGGTVRILLNISNPFDEDLIVKIRDKNSVGGMTIDTQCIQGKIPANSYGISEYESIQVHNPGIFTLGAIEVKYTNPVSGKEEVVVGKDKIDVIVTGGSPNVLFSSSSSKSECQFDEQSQEQQQQQEEEQRKQEQKEEDEMMEEMMRQQQQQMQDKLSQARQQMNQDMSSVKQQQQKEASEASERLDQELDERLSENEDFQEMKKNLEDKGYQEKGKSRSELRDNETEFKYEYEKPDGEKGEITGKMKDGEISDLKKLSDDDKRELDEKLARDEDFRQADQKLRDDGFLPDKKEFSGLDASNETDFDYQYKRADGETASITGDIQDGGVSQVGVKTSMDDEKLMGALMNNSRFKKLDDDLKSKGFERDGVDVEPFVKNESSFSLEYSNGNETVNITGSVEMVEDEMKVKDLKVDDGRTLFDKLKYPMLLVLLLLGVYSYLQYIRRDVSVDDVLGDVVVRRPVDARKEAMKLMRKAEKMYKSGKKKEAYTMVSSGVRLYFKFIICSSKDELTTSEIIRYARGKEKDGYVDDLRECFSLCDLVKFAKYKPNDKDFMRVLELAKKCVR